MLAFAILSRPLRRAATLRTVLRPSALKRNRREPRSLRALGRDAAGGGPRGQLHGAGEWGESLSAAQSVARDRTQDRACADTRRSAGPDAADIGGQSHAGPAQGPPVRPVAVRRGR